MAMTRRRKATLLALALYWPTLFVLAHIPIPQVVRRADVSDKGLHFLMYAILTFLLWGAVRPDSKVNWRRPAGWLVLLAVLAYSLLDEGLQHFVAERSADPRDLVADAAGAAAAMIVLSVSSFWSAGAIIVAIAIYTLPVLARKGLMNFLPLTTTLFYLAGYGFFTLLWMRRLRPLTSTVRSGSLRCLAWISAPLLVMAITKVSAMATGRPFETWDMVAATIGIGAGILVAHASGWPGLEPDVPVSPASIQA